MEAISILSPLVLGLLAPLGASAVLFRLWSRMTGVARGRSGRVMRAAACFLPGCALALYFLSMDSFFSRAISTYPFLTLGMAALCSALYGISAYRVWRHYNPIPVVTILYPISKGLLVVRRAIEPAEGKLAFPGGYVDENEQWQTAAARELKEETGIEVAESDFDVFMLSSTRRGHMVVIYVLAKPSAPPPATKTSPEVSELRVLQRPIEFPWDQDTEAARRYFAGRELTDGPESIPL